MMFKLPFSSTFKWKSEGYGSLASLSLSLPLALAAAGMTPHSAHAQEHSADDHHSHSAHETSGEHKPHHLSVLIGGTHIDDEDETAFTLGVDYEYRVSELIGLGFVVEQAFGEIDSTTVLAVADIHIVDGLVAQVGPGVEFIHDTEYAIGRIGVLYEFELGDHFTLSPQFHYDISEAEDAIVFGFAVGRGF